jgi:hypothetical protein
VVPLTPGSLGPYELLGELGRGGMGLVYRARHRPTGAMRAVKVLLSADDPELVVRFRREAEVLARVGGAGVVPVHEIGVERGRLWFAMGFMPKGSLADRLRARGRLEWHAAVAIVLELARALERCHAAGLVHRDLKPENVLFDEEDRPRIADFGCARDSGAASLTETGTIVGTLAYMPLEQLMGEKVDARADVFALGAILFELVTGATPFLPGRSLPELVSARQSGAPRASSFVSSIPAWLDEAITRALATRVADRPRDAAALAAALARAEKDGPRLSRTAVAAAAVVVMGSPLVVGLVVSSLRSSAPELVPPTVAPVITVAGPQAPPARPLAPTPPSAPRTTLKEDCDRAVAGVSVLSERRTELVEAAGRGGEDFILAVYRVCDDGLEHKTRRAPVLALLPCVERALGDVRPPLSTELRAKVLWARAVAGTWSRELSKDLVAVLAAARSDAILRQITANLVEAIQGYTPGPGIEPNPSWLFDEVERLLAEEANKELGDLHFLHMLLVVYSRSEASAPKLSEAERARLSLDLAAVKSDQPAADDLQSIVDAAERIRDR